MPLTHEDITKPRKSKYYESSAFAELRIRNGYTQKQLGEKLNTSNRTITRWESGYCQPNIRYIKQIADIFKCSTDVVIDALLKDADAAEQEGDTDDQ